MNANYRKLFQITFLATLFFSLLVIGLATPIFQAITWIVGIVTNGQLPILGTASLLGIGLIVLAAAARKTGWVQNGLTED